MALGIEAFYLAPQRALCLTCISGTASFKSLREKHSGWGVSQICRQLFHCVQLRAPSI